MVIKQMKYPVMIYNPWLSSTRFGYITRGYQTIEYLVSLYITEVLNFLKQSNNRQVFHETQWFFELFFEMARTSGSLNQSFFFPIPRPSGSLVPNFFQIPRTDGYDPNRLNTRPRTGGYQCWPVISAFLENVFGTSQVIKYQYQYI